MTRRMAGSWLAAGGIGVGTHGKLVGVVTANSRIWDTQTGSTYRFRCKSTIDLLCEVAKAPSIDVLPGPAKLNEWRKTTKGHRPITKEQFDAAVHAIKMAGGTKPRT